MSLACFSSAAATASGQPGSGAASTTGLAALAATFLTVFLVAGLVPVVFARASVSEAPTGIVLLMPTLRVLLTEAQIQERVKALGAQIERVKVKV